MILKTISDNFSKLWSEHSKNKSVIVISPALRLRSGLAKLIKVNEKVCKSDFNTMRTMYKIKKRIRKRRPKRLSRVFSKLSFTKLNRSSFITPRKRLYLRSNTYARNRVTHFYYRNFRRTKSLFRSSRRPTFKQKRFVNKFVLKRRKRRRVKKKPSQILFLA